MELQSVVRVMENKREIINEKAVTVQTNVKDIIPKSMRVIRINKYQ